MWATSSRRSDSGSGNPLTASVAVPMAAPGVSAPGMRPGARRGSSHGRAVCERTRHETGRKTGIELQHSCNDNRSNKTGDAHNDGQQNRLQSVAFQGLHELRAHRIADPEKEQQKKKGFRHPGNGNMRELADEQPGEKRTRHRTETEWPDLEASNPEAGANHQEQRELRVPNQELFQPGKHGNLSSSSSRTTRTLFFP